MLRLRKHTLSCVCINNRLLATRLADKDEHSEFWHWWSLAKNNLIESKLSCWREYESPRREMFYKERWQLHAFTISLTSLLKVDELSSVTPRIINLASMTMTHPATVRYFGYSGWCSLRVIWTVPFQTWLGWVANHSSRTRTVDLKIWQSVTDCQARNPGLKSRPSESFCHVRALYASRVYSARRDTKWLTLIP